MSTYSLFDCFQSVSPKQVVASVHFAEIMAFHFGGYIFTAENDVGSLSFQLNIVQGMSKKYCENWDKDSLIIETALTYIWFQIFPMHRQQRWTDSELKPLYVVPNGQIFWK